MPQEETNEITTELENDPMIRSDQTRGGVASKMSLIFVILTRFGGSNRDGKRP